MGTCAAPNCRNRSDGKRKSDGSRYRMYRFPTDPVRRKKWMINLRRRHFVPKENSSLCENHFEKNQFEQHRADGKIKLRPFAVPTIFDYSEEVRYEKPRTRKKPSAGVHGRNPVRQRLGPRKRSTKKAPLNIKKEIFEDDHGYAKSATETVNDNTVDMVEVFVNEVVALEEEVPLCTNCETLKTEITNLKTDSDKLKTENEKLMNNCESLNSQNTKLKSEVLALQKQIMFLDLALKEYLDEEQQKLLDVIAKTVEHEWENN